MITTDSLLEALEVRETRSEDLLYRGFTCFEVNLASSEHGALMLKARASNDFTASKSCVVYENMELPSRSTSLEVDANSGLTIALGKAFFIDHISFRLGKGDHSYYVEVSANLSNWIRVIDHSEYAC